MGVRRTLPEGNPAKEAYALHLLPCGPRRGGVFKARQVVEEDQLDPRVGGTVAVFGDDDLGHVGLAGCPSPSHPGGG